MIQKAHESMTKRPRLEELKYLYEKLSAEERDELLQCLLIAAPPGGHDQGAGGLATLSCT
jgi:hypothetical protein